MNRIAWCLVTVLAVVGLSSCGVSKYPGQPGVVTNGYSRVDLEDLEEDGLFIYEVSYDNRPGGPGVGAIVTKLYPNAKTYTSNVRTNADGTLYRTKGQYDGAEVQMIALPQQNQIMLSPNHRLQLFVEYDISLDEIDDRNVAEEGLFKPSPVVTWTSRALERARLKWKLLRAGNLSANGSLSYEVVAVELGGQKYTPAKPLQIETSFLQNAIRTNMDQAQRKEAALFVEKNFPKGYKGTVRFHLKGSTIPLEMKLGVHSVSTLKNNGKSVIENVSAEEMQLTLARYGNVRH